MEKRYQVFISSTFQDLKNARQEVSQALLRADCFPAGMELFPAADEEQFEFIKTIIDQSDYYVLISAGRYGSIHPETGLSYTEMEYDYAVKIGKPVIRLLHKNPINALKGEFIEKTAKGRKSLEQFRKKLTNKPQRMVKFWTNELELGSAVDHSLRHLIKTKPAIGWLPAKGRASDEAELEIFKLKEQLASFQEKPSEQSIEQILDFRLPITEAVIEQHFDIDDAMFMFELIETLENSIDNNHANSVFEMSYYLPNQPPLAEKNLTKIAAEDLIDALLLDNFFQIRENGRLSLTPSARKVIAKSRILGLDLT